MKKIIPFKKDVLFKTNLSEITSISLENTLNINNDTISGDFIISGEYKISDSSKTVEPFTLNLPFEIVIDNKYDTSGAIVDIDDFYYEIINNNTLSISIDVLIDHLSEKLLIDELPTYDIEEVSLPEDETKEEIIKEEDHAMEEERCIEEEIEEPLETNQPTLDDKREESKEEIEDKINSIFNNNTFDSDVYVTYNIFIVREGDTLESIMEKYNITEEELKKYNDLSDIKLGDKLIIPSTNERD